MSYVPFEERRAQHKESLAQAETKRREQVKVQVEKTKITVIEGMQILKAASQVGEVALTYIEILSPCPEQGLFSVLLRRKRPESERVITSRNYSSKLEIGEEYTIDEVTQGVPFSYKTEEQNYGKEEGNYTSTVKHEVIADIEGRVWYGPIVPEKVSSPNTVGVIEGHFWDTAGCHHDMLVNLAKAIGDKISQLPS